MTLVELEIAWNAQPDQYNQWDELGLDEIVHFAQQQEREACAAMFDSSPNAEMFRENIAEEIRMRSNHNKQEE